MSVTTSRIHLAAVCGLTVGLVVSAAPELATEAVAVSLDGGAAPPVPKTRRAPRSFKPDEARVRRVFDSMSLRAKAAQMLLAYPQINKSTPVEVGGVVFVGNSLSNLSKSKERIESLFARAAIPPFVAVDIEGAGSNRLKRHPAISSLPSAAEMSGLPDADVRRWGQRVGQAMRELGLNMNLAPVLDLAASGHLYDSKRVYGVEPKHVAAKATAFADGLMQEGVLAIGKHFPGYGAVAGNSDHEVVISVLSPEALSHHISAFEMAKPAIAGVMMSNVQYSAYSSRPACLTASLVDLAHAQGFITLTDDISVEALTKSVNGTSADVLRAALMAGNDLLLTTAPPDWDKGIDPIGVLERLAESDPEAMAKVETACLRLLRLKDQMGLLQGR